MEIAFNPDRWASHPATPGASSGASSSDNLSRPPALEWRHLAARLAAGHALARLLHQEQRGEPQAGGSFDPHTAGLIAGGLSAAALNPNRRDDHAMLREKALSAVNPVN